MVKTKPGQKIHVDKLQTAFDKLEQLETKPKSELTLRESILFLKDKLTAALKKGYNYQDLSEILSEQEILISAATLKQYLADMGKKSSSRRKKGKSVSSSSTKSSAKTSTNITSSKEELGNNISQTEVNRIKKVESSEQAEHLDSASGAKSSGIGQQVSSASSQSTGSKSTSTSTKPKVLSGFDDDLSSDFND